MTRVHAARQSGKAYSSLPPATLSSRSVGLPPLAIKITLLPTQPRSNAASTRRRAPAERARAPAVLDASASIDTPDRGNR